MLDPSRRDARRADAAAERGYALFDTAVGTCGVAWGPGGLTSVALPEPSRDALVGRLGASGLTEAAPPPAVAAAIDRMRRHLAGEPQDLGDVPLDCAGVPPFHRRVYDAVRGIEPGQTRSYGEIASLLGSPGAARAVGQAMAKNRFPIVVPCHRVLAGGGKPGGFSAAGGLDTKARLLSIEGCAGYPARTTPSARRPSIKRS
jgi:methylated-DNA-[protein]-cysteine S-methyltransferase